jgi:hypothetical protein
MITAAIILSFQITAIYALFQQGMMLAVVRTKSANQLDKLLGLKASRYVQKPLWDCLACMASLWTCLLSWSINIELMLLVCGINYLIEAAILEADERGIS